ncbi:hypothetical protein NNJEOMEG_01444 [Fundidesulfovibrio magnetotacticus]|uniref:DUF3828 domain-containing protein n=1 Tax=Fundidesulfovibrio magnetotacticus TaxID=2730080 RepID=A0A6V8LRL0_9BACT|nr:hypothetical protein [Fundidesulfovibrio magnetotacticus]GFK93610.1 hypothetical protein NNJEOMEG_01444 [Fundidesulfovibrio magnetotacticus]
MPCHRRTVLICCLGLALSLPIQSRAQECGNPLVAGEAVKRLIIDMDVEKLKAYFAEGFCLVDNCRDQTEAAAMLTDASSWLYRGLFVGEGSWKSRFERSTSLVIHHRQVGSRFHSLTFECDDDPSGPPIIDIQCIDGRWIISTLSNL